MLTELIPKAKHIIEENLMLATDDSISVIELTDKQEILIARFMNIGYTKEQFYAFSRELSGL